MGSASVPSLCRKKKQGMRKVRSDRRAQRHLLTPSPSLILGCFSAGAQRIHNSRCRKLSEPLMSTTSGPECGHALGASKSFLRRVYKVFKVAVLYKDILDD